MTRSHRRKYFYNGKMYDCKATQKVQWGMSEHVNKKKKKWSRPEACIRFTTDNLSGPHSKSTNHI